MKEYVETRYDYSAGRMNAPELILMVGISGSGKSTIAKRWVDEAYGTLARVNRDSLRDMLFGNVKWNNRIEDFVRNIQKEAARTLLLQGTNVIIDDTNCVRRTRQRWEEFAKELRCKFRMVQMNVPLEECIARNNKREGKEKLDESIIRTQYAVLNEMGVRVPLENETFCRPVWDRDLLAKSGFVPRLDGRKWVLVDIDGTLARHQGNRSPYDEDKVLTDSPYEVVIRWVQEIYKDYNVVVVSGRHDTCGTDTVEWLEGYKVPFDYILMRRGGDNRHDTIVKKEILDELVKVLGKENIAFVLDDRPQVVRMWRENGITVYPVRGTPEHSPFCAYTTVPKGVDNCEMCGALADF